MIYRKTELLPIPRGIFADQFDLAAQWWVEYNLQLQSARMHDDRVIIREMTRSHFGAGYLSVRALTS